MSDKFDQRSRRGASAGGGRSSPPTARRDVPRVLSAGRRRAFQVATLLLPVLVFALAEGVCRLRGYGGYPPVIGRLHGGERAGEDRAGAAGAGKDGESHWCSTVRAGTDAFFSISRAAPGGGMREIQFASPAPAGTVRIALIGESAMQGFPQPLPLTNGAFLEAMLRDVWGPEHPVEVLNFGATAVASFPIRCYIDEILESAKPDLVVLMVGNNEYYGAYGVAALPGVAASPAGMTALHSLRGLGCVQALSRALERARPTDATLMERAAAGRRIEPRDSRRAAAARSLRTHLSGMVQECVARGVPAIVCTLPTNERDLAPIGEEPEAPAAVAADFRAKLAQAEDLLPSDPAQAEGLARAAIEMQPDGARAHFLRAAALTRLGRHDEALAEYVSARDLDTMPWRATSELQQAARDAAEGSAVGATFCDMEAAFRGASEGGAIGWELMDDHVHMTLQGQALFARTLVTTLASMDFSPHVEPAALDRIPPWDAYAERLGHSVYSDFTAASHVRKIFSIPFMKGNNESVHLRFESRCRDLMAAMSATDRAAVEHWYDPSLHAASERPLEYVAGVYRATAGDYMAAEALFRFARQAVPAVSVWRLDTNWQLLRARRHLHDAPTQEDLDLCHEMIRVGELLDRFGDSANPDVPRLLGLAFNLAGEHPAAVPRLERALGRATSETVWEVTRALADSYLQVGRAADARSLLEQAARNPDSAAPARQLLDMLDAATPH